MKAVESSGDKQAAMGGDDKRSVQRQREDGACQMRAVRSAEREIANTVDIPAVVNTIGNV